MRLIPDSMALFLSQTVTIQMTTGGEAAVVLKKKIAAIRRKCCRDCAKAVAKKNYWGENETRKRNKKMVGILADIRKEMKRFVEERSVGADAWRRTGPDRTANQELHTDVCLQIFVY